MVGHLLDTMVDGRFFYETRALTLCSPAAPKLVLSPFWYPTTWYS